METALQESVHLGFPFMVVDLITYYDSNTVYLQLQFLNRESSHYYEIISYSYESVSHYYEISY